MEQTLFTNTNCPNCTFHTTRQAYFFIPSNENQLIYDDKNPKRSLRLIFDKKDPNEYLPHENEAYESFKKYFEENYFELPEDWTESETRKCLQATNFDNQKTIEKMKSCIGYHIPFMEFNNVRDILSSGFVYMHGLDCNYRPILCIIVSKFVKIMDAFPIENFIYAIYIFVKYLSKHVFIPGQVENWVMIADMSDVSFWKPPTKILKIFDFLQNKYLCKLSTLYVYGMNYVLNMCWKIVKKLIDERTAQKFNFISGQDDINELVLSKIHPSQLEAKFGGTAENIPDEIYFPFFLPSNIFQIDDRNKSQIVSEEEYIELANNNKLISISPYLISEGKIKMDIVKTSKNIFNQGEVKYNDKGNPIVNDVEYFECQSNNSKENSKLELEEEDNKQFLDGNENIKLYGRRIKGNNNGISGVSDSGTNEINTVFELGEDRTNCCKCSACLIF
jgi:hypothetical protein